MSRYSKMALDRLKEIAKREDRLGLAPACLCHAKRMRRVLPLRELARRMMGVAMGINAGAVWRNLRLTWDLRDSALVVESTEGYSGLMDCPAFSLYDLQRAPIHCAATIIVFGMTLRRIDDKINRFSA